MLTRPALSRPRSSTQGCTNTPKAKVMISRPRPLEEKANNKAKNNHAEITTLCPEKSGPFITSVNNNLNLN